MTASMSSLLEQKDKTIFPRITNGPGPKISGPGKKWDRSHTGNEQKNFKKFKLRTKQNFLCCVYIVALIKVLTICHS
jgi:hypothetical protein